MVLYISSVVANLTVRVRRTFPVGRVDAQIVQSRLLAGQMQHLRMTVSRKLLSDNSLSRDETGRLIREYIRSPVTNKIDGSLRLEHVKRPNRGTRGRYAREPEYHPPPPVIHRLRDMYVEPPIDYINYTTFRLEI